MFRSDNPCVYQFADTIPCPPPCCHHVLTADGSQCLACGDDITLELDAEAILMAIRPTAGE